MKKWDLSFDKIVLNFGIWKYKLWKSSGKFCIILKIIFSDSFIFYFHVYQKLGKLGWTIIFHAIFWPPCYSHANYRPRKKFDWAGYSKRIRHIGNRCFLFYTYIWPKCYIEHKVYRNETILEKCFILLFEIILLYYLLILIILLYYIIFLHKIAWISKCK